MDEYFVKDNGEEKGPFTFDELTDGRLEPNDMVRTPVSGWARASEMPEFTEYFQSEGYYFANEQSLASFGMRVLAFVIDYFIYSFLLGIGLYFYITNQPAAEALDINNLAKYDGVKLAAAIVFFCYNTICLSLASSATLGHMVCRLMVVDEEGRKLSVSRAAARSGLKLLSFMFFGLGFFVAIFNGRRQGLHDIFAKTFVIRKDVF